MTRLLHWALVWSLVLAAASARADPFHFEAWPTSATDGCPAPCYQVRMFLEMQPWWPQEVTAIQVEIGVGYGAVPAELYVPPGENNGNSGPGTLWVAVDNRPRAVPWNLSSIVARAHTDGFDVLLLHAASAPFTVQALESSMADPDTSCLDDPARCELVTAALALDRIYLGFFNVTRQADAPVGPAYDWDHHTNSDFIPPGTPYFWLRVGQPIGNGGFLAYACCAGSGPIPFLPEPSPALLLAGALALLLARRASARRR